MVVRVLGEGSGVAVYAVIIIGWWFGGMMKCSRIDHAKEDLLKHLPSD